MKKICKNDLKNVTEKMVDIFINTIDISTVINGIEPTTARKLVYETMWSDLNYFYKYGEIFVYDEEFNGIITLINGKKFSLFKRILSSLSDGKRILKVASKEEVKLFTENSKKVQEVHSFNWYKKRKNIPFYLAHIGIDEKQRGNGICRGMFEFIFDYVKKYNSEIAIETLSTKTASIYEHFGFETIEIVESKDKSLREFRMIKKL